MFLKQTLKEFSSHALKETRVPIIHSDPKFTYFFEYSKNRKSMYMQLLMISIAVSKRFPKHYNVLFCSANTNINEVQVIFYRVFTCENKEAFFLVNPDDPPYDSQQKFIEIHKKSTSRLLKKKNKKI